MISDHLLESNDRIAFIHLIGGRSASSPRPSAPIHFGVHIFARLGAYLKAHSLTFTHFSSHPVQVICSQFFTISMTRCFVTWICCAGRQLCFSLFASTDDAHIIHNLPIPASSPLRTDRQQLHFRSQSFRCCIAIGSSNNTIDVVTLQSNGIEIRAGDGRQLWLQADRANIRFHRRPVVHHSTPLRT